MEFFSNPTDYRPLAIKSITQFGYAPEHNLDWFEDVTELNQQIVFVRWLNGTGLLTQKEEKAWYIFVEPLAPVSQRGRVIAEFCEYALNQPNIKKVVMELCAETRRELLEILPPTLKSRAINYSMEWPVMNMEKFDPELTGGHFKSIRNAKNKFYREHQISIVSPEKVTPKELKDIVDIWIKNRGGHDKPWFQRYYALINNQFKGCNTARVMMTDGKVIGFNAGWKIPNSQNQWYATIGIHDYSIRDLGLMLYLEDLEWIKKAGYKTADMGGGEEALTHFKNQFLPESSYKTFVFSITKA